MTNKRGSRFIDLRNTGIPKYILKYLELLLGNEGKGLSIEIQNLCTKFLTIPVQGNTKIKELDSLNVSVATGLYKYCYL